MYMTTLNKSSRRDFLKITSMTGGGLLLGLVLGFALAFFLENIKPRVRCIEDVTETLKLQVLATIPEMKNISWKVTS